MAKNMSSFVAKKLDAPPWCVEQIEPNIHLLTLPFRRLASWEQWVLLTADRHWDNPKTNLALQKKHLELAKKRNAPVLDFGDFFCAMQGRYDPRRDLKEIRPEHNVPEYLDALRRTATEWFSPYKDQFAVIGRGNHETSVHKNCGVDLTQGIVDGLRDRGSRVCSGGYAGWVRFRFVEAGTKKVATVQSTLLYYHHGYGGDSPVTRGTIQTARMGLYLPDPDIVVTGHTHNEWVLMMSRVRLSRTNRQYKDEQAHIKIPSYKDDFGTGAGGWHVERGGPPKTTGAVWLRFYFEQAHPEGEHSPQVNSIRFEVMRAQ